MPRSILTVEESRLTVRQLVVTLDQPAAFLNGVAVQMTPAPRVANGRTLLPLRETARVLGLPIEVTAQGMRLGHLEVLPALNRVRVDGVEKPIDDYALVLDGVTFATMKAFEQAVGATIAFDPAQRLVTVTVSTVPTPDPTLPVARFSTDKREYRIGEPVKVLDFSFDPDGLPLTGRKFSGREEAFFTPGDKTISLTVTNSLGRTSPAYSLTVHVTPDVLATPREYALRYSPLGRTFLDDGILSYPTAQATREDDAGTLIVSDSPEAPNRSGLLYEDVVTGATRVLAHHINALATPARLVLLASNLDQTTTSVQVTRVGETSATRVVSTLGQGSLVDFLTSNPRDSVRLAAAQVAPVYVSPPLAPGQGLNLMLDLTASGRAQVSIFLVEDALFGGEMRAEALSVVLRALPVLEPDGRHVRGTFNGTTRKLTVDLATANLDTTGATRVIVGDGTSDPWLTGRDALTGKNAVLPGNYGLTYRLSLANAAGTVVAFAPRGGLYSGVVTVNGDITPVPANGVLSRQDSPLILSRQTPAQNGSIELEMIPASGSNLPVNFVIYRLPAPRQPAPEAAPPSASNAR